MAARLLGAAAALRDAARSPMIAAEQVEHDEWAKQLRATAHTAKVDVAWAAGRTTSLLEAVAVATAI